MKLKIKNYKLINLACTALLALGCGTWVGSPGENEDGEAAQEMEGPKDSKAASPADPPVGDGVWKVFYSRDDDDAECEKFSMSYRDEGENPGILELVNADPEDENSVSFETTLPDGSVENLALVSLTETGFYTINVSYDVGDTVSECVLTLSLMELNDEESYKIEFSFD